MVLVLTVPWAAWIPAATFLGLAFAGALFPAAGLMGPVVTHGDRSTNLVALTFDDGPDPETTPALLDLLDRHNAKATFFVVGDRVESAPALVKEIFDRGHAIGNHTATHDVLLALRGRRRVVAQIAGCNASLARIGVEARYFRPPAGVLNPLIGQVVTNEGLECILFSRRALDFGNRFTKDLSSRILDGVKGGDILMMHDRTPQNGVPVSALINEFDCLLKGLNARNLLIVELERLIRVQRGAHE